MSAIYLLLYLPTSFLIILNYFLNARNNDMEGPKQIQENAGEPFPGKGRVERIKEYLLDNLESDLSLIAVATKFEISASTLRHTFKKHQHQSYQSYREEIRMQRSWHLLINEDKRIKEIIYATGYKSRAAFNKAFKKKFKHPPSYFRN
jgi:AraC-like DNA-binding protein